jgi:hypothetical protein
VALVVVVVVVVVGGLSNRAMHHKDYQRSV